MWRRFEMWVVCESLIAVERRCPFVSIDRLDWAMAVWIYGWYTHEWGNLPNCEKTVRCDADSKCDACEALWWLSNAVVRLFLSTVWTELWLFEYMGDIHMSEIASLIKRKLWGVTQIQDVMLVRLCDSCRTPLSVCFYRPSGLSYGCLNIWAIYTWVR